MAKKKKGGSTLVWALMLLLLLGLGGFGVTNFGGTMRSIATVGDREITVEEYGRALQQDMRQISAQTGQPVGMEMMQAIGRDAQLREAMINAAVLANEADRIGISVGDDDVRKKIMTAPIFQGASGAFDRTAYTDYLRNERLSDVDFETRMREDAARGILQEAVSGGLATPDIFASTLTSWAAETRDFTDAELIAADLNEPLAEPTEEELQAHYAANIGNFTSLETRAISYIWLKPEDLVGGIEIDEAAIKAAYEARISEFVTPERRLVERLVYGTDADAAAAKARVDAGEATFADLVAERGLELADVDLGEVSAADLGSAGAEVFALAEPGVVGPLPSNLGPALYSMNGVLMAQETTLDEVRDDLKGEIALDRARRAVIDRSSEVADLLAGGETLERVGEMLGMTVGKIDIDTTTEDGIAAYSAFRKKALAVTTSDFPEVAELEDGGIYALRLDELRAPAPIPLDDVRDDVLASWRLAETQTRLEALADSYLAKLEGGATLESLGLVVTRRENVTRGSFIEGQPASVLAEALRLSEGGYAVVKGAGVHLIRVDAVHPVDVTDPDVIALRETVNSRSAEGMADDIFVAFTSALQAKAGVSLNPTAINAVNAQLP